MQTLAPTSSLHAHWQQLVYTEAALLARPETAPYAVPFTELLTEYEGLRQIDLSTQRGIIRAQARSAAADLDIDMTIRDVHNDTLHTVGQDRRAPLVRTLFKSDIASTVRFALKKQLEVAEALVQAMPLSIVPAALRERFVPLLTEVIERGRQVLGERAAQVHERTEARIAIDDFKADVNAARLSLYGALLGHAAKRRRPKSWAEAFFMKSRSRNSGANEIDAEAEVEPEIDDDGLDLPLETDEA